MFEPSTEIHGKTQCEALVWRSMCRAVLPWLSCRVTFGLDGVWSVTQLLCWDSQAARSACVTPLPWLTFCSGVCAGALPRPFFSSSPCTLHAVCIPLIFGDWRFCTGNVSAAVIGIIYTKLLAGLLACFYQQNILQAWLVVPLPILLFIFNC